MSHTASVSSLHPKIWNRIQIPFRVDLTERRNDPLGKYAQGTTSIASTREE